MRTTQLPYEVEALLRKDFHAAQKHIEEILIGGKPNRPVLTPHYLTPRVDATVEVPRSDDHGELHHYRRVRNVLEYIFEHDGKIREKYREMLQQIHAPQHIMGLIA
jgi:hypothetical protein